MGAARLLSGARHCAAGVCSARARLGSESAGRPRDHSHRTARPQDHKTPAQVALAWAVQCGTAFLTTSTKPRYIQENFEVSTLPEDALREMREGITANVRFNTVVETGVPGFIPPGGVTSPG